MNSTKKAIWVFGDYRNYFQNRVTLQLLAKAADLAKQLNGTVCAVVAGHETGEWVDEYIAHGAEKVIVADHPDHQERQVIAPATSRRVPC